VIYEYRDRFSDRFITASARHNGIQIRAVGQQAIDTTSPAGRMMLQMLGSFAEFERAIFANVPRWVWKALAGKDASAAAVRSSDHSSRRKSLRWFRGVEERLPMLHAFSTCIRRLFVAS
jgi:hypothetical protein